MPRSNDPRKFLTSEETTQVDAAIEEAETTSSAELKLVIARHCWGSIKRKAAMLFHQHGLDQTEQRNCVLVLLVTTNREFVIYGDQGIHDKVGQEFWDDVRDVVVERFKGGEFGEGLASGIRRIGEKLAEHFPYHADDVDEIPDEVGFEN